RAHAQPSAHFLGHGTRRPPADKIFRRCSPALSYAVEVDDCYRPSRWNLRRISASSRTGGPGQYRHALRLCHRLLRRAHHPPHRSESAARLSHTICAARADSRRALLSLAHDVAAAGQLAATAHLDDHWSCHLLLLRPQALTLE